MVAVVEPADDGDLDERADAGGGREAGNEAQPEGTGGRRDRRAGEGADHVERTVREVDEAHDAEDQRQAGGHQKQHHAELKSVEQLFDQECGEHGVGPGFGSGSRQGRRPGIGEAPGPGRSGMQGRYRPHCSA